MSRKSRNMFYQNTSTRRSAEIKEFLLFMKDCVKKHASAKIGQQLLLEHIFSVIPKKFLRVLNCFFDRNVVHKNYFNGLLYQALQAMLFICIRSNSLAVHKPQICILSFIIAENV